MNARLICESGIKGVGLSTSLSDRWESRKKKFVKEEGVWRKKKVEYNLEGQKYSDRDLGRAIRHHRGRKGEEERGGGGKGKGKKDRRSVNGVEKRNLKGSKKGKLTGKAGIKNGPRPTGDQRKKAATRKILFPPLIKRRTDLMATQYTRKLIFTIAVPEKLWTAEKEKVERGLS